MGGEMSSRSWALRFQLVGLCTLVLVPTLYCLAKGDFSLSTADQRGYRLLSREKYQEAAA